MAYCRVCHKQKPDYHFEDYPAHRADGPKRTLAAMDAAPDTPASYKPRGSAGSELDTGATPRPAPRRPARTPGRAPASGSDRRGIWGRIIGGAAVLVGIGAPIAIAVMAARRELGG